MERKNKKMLIVDDDIKTVEFIESYFINDNIDIYKAFTGREALSIFYSNQVDLILLDVVLPDISGEQICNEIRKKSNTPIIMLSGNSSDECIINGLNIGADDYITKPFNPRELISRVNALYRRVNNDIP